ncbi:MAG: aminodeoxychorismate synthase component I [Bacteroidales bacterium]|nr:aminodeoxychorismate synthase component I [Bacteroidales bacterium]
MKFIDTEQVRKQINKASSQQTPFFFAINYEMSEGLFIDNPLNQSEALFHFKGIANKSSKQAVRQNIELTVYPIAKEEYRLMFELAQQGLKSGEINVINLTARTPISTNINCSEMFFRSQSPYRIYVPGKFICFSPERFVKIENGIISSNPMKGTIDASIPNAEQVVLHDSKEIAEHTATVQLVSEELSSVAHNVGIKRFRYIDQIESQNRTLLQVSSEIVGKLPNDYMSRMGDIIFSLLPAASITGSPKTKTIEYISLAEVQPRGYYCGIAGYFDGKTLDTTVLIRFIEIDGKNMFFRSGGGVTIDSICEKEYQEVLDKIYLPII